MFKALSLFTLVVCALAAPVEVAELAPCSPLELVFARGTSEEGLGIVGTPLAAQLRSLVSGATAYNVDYPSSAEYVVTPQVGANDAQSHIAAQAAACPNQRFAIAGYSKGGIVSHLITLPSALQSKVVAVAVFGDPYRLTGDAFPVNSQSNVISFCNIGDPVCLNGANILAHLAYATDGSVGRAASFIASHYGA